MLKILHLVHFTGIEKIIDDCCWLGRAQNCSQREIFSKFIWGYFCTLPRQALNIIQHLSNFQLFLLCENVLQNYKFEASLKISLLHCMEDISNSLFIVCLSQAFTRLTGVKMFYYSFNSICPFDVSIYIQKFNRLSI